VKRVFIAIAAGIALADASIVTLGLPSILIDLHSTVEGVALVLGIYTAVLALALLPASWLCEWLGDARVGAAGFALFLLASVGCGASDSLGLLLVLRGVQALGGAAGLVAAFALLDGGRPGVGRRMWVAASVFGIAIGPALGGALTQAFSWRAIFFAQAPIVLPGLLVALQVARTPAADWLPEKTERTASPLPWRPAVALGLVSASLTAVVFLVVLLLVSGWSVEPLTAALAVSVLPVAAIASSRIPGDPHVKAVCGSLLVAGGVACLALLPGASAWWTVIPQVLAGAGMGLALTALSGELLPERNRREVARLLAIRHAGIAIALALLAPLISSHLTSTIDTAREQGTAVVLDANLPPEDKIKIAPDLFGSLNTDDPRGQLQQAVAKARSDLDGDDAAELGRLGDRLDDVVTSAVRSAFRPAFIVTSVFALLAALLLLTGPGRAAAALARPALATALVAAVIAVGGYGVAYASSTKDEVRIEDPCHDRDLPDVGGITGALQNLSLEALDNAACKFGSSREELLLALFDDRLQHKFEEEHGVNPRDVTSIGPAILGF
jgi:MFS family permease